MNREQLVDIASKIFYGELVKSNDPDVAAAETRQTISSLSDQDSVEAAITGLLDTYRRDVGKVRDLHELHGVRTEVRTDGHPWYAGPDHYDRSYWKSLSSYLREKKEWPESRLGALERSSIEITADLGNPGATEFDIRGMVVGHIQSGKTASMTGVIAMAADAGYEVIVVLSGLTNALRKQTQLRLEEELCRSTDQVSERWRLLTTDQMDFSGIKVDPNSDFKHDDSRCQLAIIKKNVSPLKQLIKVLEEIPPGHRRDRRFLFIDDECDQAGVNAAKDQQEAVDPEETNRTRINQLITTLIGLPGRMSYVGYTATPYANVLVNSEDTADIFPRDFIKLLDPPPIYYGMERLFGRDPSTGDEPGVDGLDAIRLIPKNDVGLLRPESKDKDVWAPGSLPESLTNAFDHFLMTTAARRLRGQTDVKHHSTMLVHFTHLVAPQRAMAETIEKLLVNDRHDRVISMDKRLKKDMETIWRSELGRVPREPGVREVQFEEIWSELPSFIKEVEVIQEHGDSTAHLEFEKRRHYAVVVGGNILSRGLTVEGLCVSYFVRPSKQYDSLSQMGRWFGYRIGYEDLVRIWIDEGLADDYRDIARIDHELRIEIERLSRLGATPAQLPIRIRTHPTLRVTSALKMQWAQEDRPDFEGRHWQTTIFTDGTRIEDQEWLSNVLEESGAWIDEVHDTYRFQDLGDGGHLATGVSIGDVARLLKTYQRDVDDGRFPTRLLIQHLKRIREADPDSPSQRWNVVVDGLKRSQTNEGIHFGSQIRIRPWTRTRKFTKVSTARGHHQPKNPEFDIKGLFGTLDLARDFPPDEIPSKASRAELLAMRREEAGSVVKHPLLTIVRIDRSSRPKNENNNQGPLEASHDLVGLGVVFPSSHRGGSIMGGGMQGVDQVEILE